MQVRSGVETFALVKPHDGDLTKARLVLAGMVAAEVQVCTRGKLDPYKRLRSTAIAAIGDGESGSFDGGRHGILDSWMGSTRQ